MKSVLLVAAAAWVSACSVPAEAIDLVEAWDLARKHDPQFQAARAERDINLATASQSLAAYLPQAQYQMTNLPQENLTRQVVTVTQPIISVDRYALLRQRAPRKDFAEATFDVREQNLAQRTLKAVIDLIRSTESLRLNVAKIDALREQSQRAEKLYQAGQGTLTDARDIAVRYEQAQANQVILESEQGAAANRFEALTGVKADPAEFRLPEQHASVPLNDAETYLAALRESNPQIRAAIDAERIGRLDVLRARGSVLPTVGFSASYSRAGGNDNSFVGLSITAPLNAGGIFQVRAASAAARRSSEERRQTQERTRVDFERLYSLVQGGQRSLASTRRAVEAGELSVEANKKSYEGGVRSNVDVVNSIQVLFEVKNQYVVSATNVAENLLDMQLLAATDPRVALATTQSFLFRR
jgi:protease secretion system outer membrane protein